MNREVEKPWLTAAVLFLAALVVSLLYQHPPRLGDDIEYWGLAMDLHQGVPGAWKSDSFHDLRWPVWGVCWLLQIPFGFGAWGYYLEPVVYLGGGAILVFFLAAKIGMKPVLRWAAAVVFLFHPLLDPSLSRPMPDLSEGFWVAMSFFLWLHLVEAKSGKAKLALSVLTGLALAVAQANRITGVFAVPVLVVATLALYPRQIGWLVLCGMCMGVFVTIEAAIYHQLTGDWLHALHANMGAKGRKGTEEIALWQLPFRFLPLVWRLPQDILFSTFTCLGLILASTRLGRGGKALALYAVVYYLTYSCALQEISPPRPLVRDGERFLASSAYPFSVLAACGLSMAALILIRVPGARRVVEFLRKHPAGAVAGLAILLGVISDRGHAEENYLPQIRAYLETIPDGTRVYSHDILRYVASMANPGKTAKIDWTLDSNILNPGPEGLKKAEGSEQIWLVRKHAWVRNRKRSEMGRSDQLGQLAPYLTPPMAGWEVAETVAKGDVPDFLFLKRTEQGDGMRAETFGGELLPGTLPLTWEEKTGKREKTQTMAVPEALRGREIFLWLKYASDKTEPVRIRIEFFAKPKGKLLQSLLLKPYFFPEASPDFFAFEIPKDATVMTISTRIARSTEWIRLDDWKALSY